MIRTVLFSSATFIGLFKLVSRIVSFNNPNLEFRFFSNLADLFDFRQKTSKLGTL